MLDRRLEYVPGRGRPLSSRALQTQRSVEAYLKGGVLPRFMERLREIDGEVAQHRRRLGRAHRTLQEACAGDAEHFAERWTEQAHRWSFERVNELIREHNEWYPIETQLPMDPRTRDYVPVGGQSYRRTELGPEWVLEQFPARS